MQDVGKPSEQLLTLVVRSCANALWIMPELIENENFESVKVLHLIYFHMIDFTVLFFILRGL